MISQSSATFADLSLALAEQQGLSIHAVATPTHVFVRYDDGETTMNIETFPHGASSTALSVAFSSTPTSTLSCTRSSRSDILSSRSRPHAAREAGHSSTGLSP